MGFLDRFRRKKPEPLPPAPRGSLRDFARSMYETLDLTYDEDADRRFAERTSHLIQEARESIASRESDGPVQ